MDAVLEIINHIDGINMKDATPCIRCGKIRIEAKSWSEKLSGTLITYTMTVCPDPQCQKIVDSKLQENKDKIEAIHNKSLERRKAIKRVRKSKVTK